MNSKATNLTVFSVGNQAMTRLNAMKNFVLNVTKWAIKPETVALQVLPNAVSASKTVIRRTGV